MDCFADQNDDSCSTETYRHVSSPEMFDSETESDIEMKGGEHNDDALITRIPEISQAELVAKSDKALLSRINKYLSGVPPPPKHTISQRDCADFLEHIYKNRELFLSGFCPLPGEHSESTIQSTKLQSKEDDSGNIYQLITRTASRNLTNHFDACDPPADSTENVELVRINGDNLSTQCSVPNKVDMSVNVITKVSPIRDNSNVSQEQSSLLYHTISEKEAVTLAWPEAYFHKFYGMHYNRSRVVEDFENLTIKLCERYVGAETQSTCNIWFSKQPSSPKKRSLLAKRVNGQSPEKRLTHLARRRKTFSSANLQGLAEKKQFMVQINPPTDRAGPSKLLHASSVDTQKIKRVLFSTLNKNETKLEDNKPIISREESRKRKYEDELQGPRVKWPKSLSFDCAHELENTSKIGWERHSSSNLLMKTTDTSFNQGKNELSDTHRKKLFWAVTEALRSKGIDMSHPKFKQYATHLARTIKKYMPDLENRDIPRKPGSTSERMLKLAKHHVLLLIDTRPTD
ncbi:uncharacterized protein LOC109855797 isoform X2 [Pseudomyrmex gracilis]|uniref:uncharacterized protein LOC109855797 isoform X2 n=1 Tax=Pseudomyrmex gracilis TaxID=219809 RepID=UPI000995A0E4|nr:uncharacterized protein LOC109855797 isoform X2 [Pseudomyrmex gracilis]